MPSARHEHPRRLLELPVGGERHPERAQIVRGAARAVSTSLASLIAPGDFPRSRGLVRSMTGRSAPDATTAAGGRQADSPAGRRLTLRRPRSPPVEDFAIYSQNFRGFCGVSGDDRQRRIAHRQRRAAVPAGPGSATGRAAAPARSPAGHPPTDGRRRATARPGRSRARRRARRRGDRRTTTIALPSPRPRRRRGPRLRRRQRLSLRACSSTASPDAAARRLSPPGRRAR